MKLKWNKYKDLETVVVASVEDDFQIALLEEDKSIFWTVLPHGELDDWFDGQAISLVEGEAKSRKEAETNSWKALKAWLKEQGVSVGYEGGWVWPSESSSKGKTETRDYPVEFYRDEDRVMLVPPVMGNDIDVTDVEELQFLKELEDGEIDVHFSYYFYPREKATKRDPGFPAFVEIDEINTKHGDKWYDLSKVFDQKVGDEPLYKYYQEQILDDIAEDGPDY